MDTAVSHTEPVRAFRLTLTVEGLRPDTVHNYARAVDRFAEAISVPPGGLRPIYVRAFVHDLQEHCSPKTIHELQRNPGR